MIFCLQLLYGIGDFPSGLLGEGGRGEMEKRRERRGRRGRVVTVSESRRTQQGRNAAHVIRGIEFGLEHFM